jgi:hypothetical protein
VKYTLSHQYLPEFQNRMTAIVIKLCMVPIPKAKLWCSGGARDGWFISGVKGGDCFLPDTKGVKHWWEAINIAETWIEKIEESK